ncbi:hypothetical protein [Caballeronia sp. Lep1P3]|uniref:hypothetical protein n=1 Tax=Caballeronia sp. Lep1P3 TaxID=2878150 RepID=UPI001FD090DD|nr:hypothetical protein [Caballeronia sp. Lep1P3]
MNDFTEGVAERIDRDQANPLRHRRVRLTCSKASGGTPIESNQTEGGRSDWTVTCTTAQGPQGFVCSIGVEHRNVEGGRFVHRFCHACTLDSERDAVIAGLREGIAWIGLEAARTIAV